MSGHETRLVTLVTVGGRGPMPPPVARGRGRPPLYPERRLVQAVGLMIVRHGHTVHTRLSVLAQPTSERQTGRALLPVAGRFPTRRPGARRFQALPTTWPAHIGGLGRALVAMMRPWASCGRAAASDRPGLRARGGVWHKKAREAGLGPHTSMATAAHWTTSGWHGWGDGWQRPLVTTVAAGWSPLAADLTPATGADPEPALPWLPELPAEVRAGLGDQHDRAPALAAACDQAGRTVGAPRRGPSPPTEAGVGVRRVLHARRSRAIEHLHAPVKGSFAAHSQVPTTGLRPTRRLALGAVFVYPLTLWVRYEHGLDLRVG